MDGFQVFQLSLPVVIIILRYTFYFSSKTWTDEEYVQPFTATPEEHETLPLASETVESSSRDKSNAQHQ